MKTEAVRAYIFQCLFLPNQAPEEIESWQWVRIGSRRQVGIGSQHRVRIGSRRQVRIGSWRRVRIGSRRRVRIGSRCRVRIGSLQQIRQWKVLNRRWGWSRRWRPQGTLKILTAIRNSRLYCLLDRNPVVVRLQQATVEAGEYPAQLFLKNVHPPLGPSEF